jgi:uncharacterized protein (UPF0332 family)
VSRSYYALYHEAVATADLLKLSPDPKVRTSHDKLISRYCEATKGLAALGRTIRKQKQLRAMADYELTADITRSEAHLHLATSKRVISALKQIASAEAG